MKIPDLSESTYLGQNRRDHSEFARLYPQISTRSIGWLGDEVPRTGDVPREVLEALEFYSRRNRVADFLLGEHTCEICHAESAHEEFWIIWKDVRYVLPVMVLHYIRAHRYLPPDEFIQHLSAKWAAEKDGPSQFEFDRRWQMRTAGLPEAGEQTTNRR